MTDHMNGTKQADDIPANVKNMGDFISAYCGPVTSCAINGCIRSLAHLPIDAVMIMLCACFGRCLGQVLSIGDKLEVSQLRQRCVDAFSGELRKQVIHPMMVPPGKPATAVAPDQQELVNKLKGGG